MWTRTAEPVYTEILRWKAEQLTATQSPAKVVMLNHDFYWQAGDIKENQGNGSVIGGNTSYYLHNTSGNTAS